MKSSNCSQTDVYCDETDGNISQSLSTTADPLPVQVRASSFPPGTGEFTCQKWVLSNIVSGFGHFWIYRRIKYCYDDVSTICIWLVKQRNDQEEKANQTGFQSEDPAWKKAQKDKIIPPLFYLCNKNLTMAGERQENEERAVGKGRSSGQV